MRFSLTLEGKLTVFFSLILFFAANNVGNNLLFLLGSGFASFMAVSFVMGYLNIKGLSFVWEENLECFAGQPLKLRLTLLNSTWQKRFFLQVKDQDTPFLSPNSSVNLFFSIPTVERGRLEILTLSLVSYFPFGLFHFSLDVPPVTAWVFPMPEEFHWLGGDFSGGIVDRKNDDALGEFWMQRKYQPGENAKLINWQVSARSNEEWVSVRTTPRNRPIYFWLTDTGIPGYEFEQFLARVSFFAVDSYQSHETVFAWCIQPDGSGDWLNLSVPYQLKSFLRWLAEVQPGQTKLPTQPSGREGLGIGFSPEMLSNGQICEGGRS